MDRQVAAQVLGVAVDAPPSHVRAAYRRLLLRTHPDVSGDAGATDATVRLTEAFAVMSQPAPVPAASGRPAGGAPPHPPAGSPGRRHRSTTGARSGAHRGPTDATGEGPSPSVPPPPPPWTGPVPSTTWPGPAPVLVDADTIAVPAPPDETLLLVLEAAHRLGDVAYLDPSAGLVEVVVEFVEAPTSSVLMTLQGRATGVTEVFCTVEPLSGGDAPPADAVTRLVLATLGELRVNTA